MEECILSRGVEFVSDCVYVCVWTVECANAGACHIGSIINEHGLQGQLDQAWGIWVIWRVVQSGLLAQLC